MPVALVVVRGRSEGTRIPIATSPFLIGRDSRCHLRPRSSQVSKWHCVISVKADGAYVRDLNSLNGTFVNGRRIKQEVRLRNGDLITIGPLVFAVAVEEPLERPATGAEPRDFEQTVAEWIAAGDGADPTHEEITAESTTIMDAPVGEPAKPPEATESRPHSDDRETTSTSEDRPNSQAGSTAEVADRLLEMLFEPRRRS